MANGQSPNQVVSLQEVTQLLGQKDIEMHHLVKEIVSLRAEIAVKDQELQRLRAEGTKMAEAELTASLGELSSPTSPLDKLAEGGARSSEEAA